MFICLLKPQTCLQQHDTDVILSLDAGLVERGVAPVVTGVRVWRVGSDGATTPATSPMPTTGVHICLKHRVFAEQGFQSI